MLVLVHVYVLVLGGAAEAQNGKILRQDRNSSGGEGYTVLRVWGTPQEMGYAQGFMLAKDGLAMVSEVKGKLGNKLGLARTAMSAAVWRPPDIEQELQGMIDGLKAAQPDASVDIDDLRLVNTLGDWMYYACRSHSAWGHFVSGPTRTLSTRRLDFSPPVPSARHHVLLARAPTGNGSVQWVNLGWAGMVTAVTAVNEYGTLASLHDYTTQTKMVPGAHMPRMAAVRFALTMVGGLSPETHLDAVYAELEKQSVMTGTFLNYYVPEGHGGVITCLAGKPCTKKRVPQAGYFDGEVLLTTNQETDGLSAPSDDSAMNAYYKAGGQKSIADHYAVMGHGGLHLLSVDFRGRGDMTLWAEGRTSTGVTPTIKVEWAELFQGTPPPSDGPRSDGQSRVARDGSAVDHGPAPRSEADPRPPDKSSGCSCAVASRAAGAGLLLLLAALGLACFRSFARR